MTENRNNASPVAENISSVFVDHKNKKVIFVTKDILINQLQRDGLRISKSFDDLLADDLKAISSVIADALSLIYTSIDNSDDGFRSTSARLLSSAISSFVASVEVARHGFRRPYGATARGVVEALATVVQIAVDPKALERFHAGELKSTKSISFADKILPVFGRINGVLSKYFVHIGRDHAIFETTSVYKPDEEAMAFIAQTMRSNAFLIYAVSEMVFCNDIDCPRLWKKFGAREVAFEPSPEARDWMEDFLKLPM